MHFFLSHDNIYESLVNSTKQTLKNIEAWLSLVERCVRDAEVASSNLVASIPACWSSGQDDALSRRKPGFDSRTGHEAVWNFHTASFFILYFIALLFCHRIVPALLLNLPVYFSILFAAFRSLPHVFPHTISPNFISRFLYKKIFTNNSWFLPSFCCNMCYNNNR